jgi:hypothetical protein
LTYPESNWGNGFITSFGERVAFEKSVIATLIKNAKRIVAVSI